MNRVMMISLVVLLSSPAVLHAATWENAPLIDSMCSEKFMEKQAEHTVACAIQCADSGYGIIVDGQFVKFDDRGNELALQALKDTSNRKDVRVTVEGQIEGETIRVSELSIN